MKLLFSATAALCLASASSVQAQSDNLPGRTAEYVQDICRDQLVPELFATVGECVSTFRGDIVEFCKFLADNDIIEVAAGRCVGVFSKPREPGDD